MIAVADVLSVLCKAHQTRSHWLTVYCALYTNRPSTPNLTHSAQLITLYPKVRHYHDPVSRQRKGLTVKILHAFLPFSFLLVLSQNLRFPCVESIVWPKYMAAFPSCNYSVSYIQNIKYQLRIQNPFFFSFTPALENDRMVETRVYGV